MFNKAASKKNNVLKILGIGGAILTASLLMCIFFVGVLQKTYISEVREDYQQRHISMGDILSNLMTQTSLTASEGANQMMAGRYYQNEKTVYELLEQYSSRSYVDTAGYLSSSGDLYLNGEKYTKDTADERLKQLWNNIGSSKGKITKVGAYIGLSDNQYQIMFAVPVYNDDNVFAGHFIVFKDVSSYLLDEAFQTHRSIGECYIITVDMSIVGRSFYAELIPTEGNFSAGMLEYTGDSDKFRKRMQIFRNSLITGNDGYTVLDIRRDDSLQISYCELKVMDGLYFVTCYSNKVTDSKVQPLLFRCALMCLVIMVIMIMLIIYVWATSKSANLTIEKLAYEDSVTKGKNLNYFKEFSLKVMNLFNETPFIIYRFDIVNFRYINEAYGHKRADLVLKSCIENFENVFSDKELCVRMNADQFLAIIVNDQYLEKKYSQYKDRVNADARGHGIKYPIKFKTGVYQIKKHDKDIDVMIDHANVARKTVANSEKEMRVIYTEKLVNDIHKVDKIESDMQNALANGEFRIYYQPKWDVMANHVAGAEALIRWVKADGTTVYPDVFIPIFEQNGFIEILDFYTLEEVCKQMRELLDKGRTVYPVSVNQSRVLLHNPDYVASVTKIIKKYNIPENAIELEITETVFQDDREGMIEIMHQLKKCGVRLSMDDFGSGYSSLNMLRNAPFDIIKIDREFFSESVTTPASMWILQKIIEMSNGLGMEIICEGVETGEQAILLKNLGCRLVQGYFYSRPIPAENYIKQYCE
mgnify:CR=1 FL=1